MSCRPRCLRWATVWRDNRTSSPFKHAEDLTTFRQNKAVYWAGIPRLEILSCLGQTGSRPVPRWVTSLSAWHHGQCSLTGTTCNFYFFLSIFNFGFYKWTKHKHRRSDVIFSVFIIHANEVTAPNIMGFLEVHTFSNDLKGSTQNSSVTPILSLWCITKCPMICVLQKTLKHCRHLRHRLPRINSLQFWYHWEFTHFNHLLSIYSNSRNTHWC